MYIFVILTSLQETFGKFGKIKDIKIRSKNKESTFAFIEYEEEGSAQLAIDAMHKTDYEGSDISV